MGLVLVLGAIALVLTLVWFAALYLRQLVGPRVPGRRETRRALRSARSSARAQLEGVRQ